MTTNNNITTPYDAAIAAYNVVQEGSQRLAHLRGLQQGWIVAKAEDAALLEAAKEAEAWFKHFGYNAFGITMSDDNPDHERIRIQLTQAIAKHEGSKP